MKKRMLIAIACGGALFLQSDLPFAASDPAQDKENSQTHYQQQPTGNQPVTKQNRPENDAGTKINAADTGKKQGPAPVILQIRLVDKTAD